MEGCQVNVAPITCKLSKLTVCTADPNEEYQNAILQQDESFSLRVTVEFGGPGAIALMPLGMSIQVNFFAEPYGVNSKVELGKTSMNTSSKIFTYTPTLAVAKSAHVGLILEEIYQVTAVLRVGEPNWPAFIIGFIEGFAIQTY